MEQCKIRLLDKKENINEECIREFDGDVMTVTERLATVPAGLHPSHPGHAAAMRMSAMASQVKVIQHRSGPKKKHPSQVQKTAVVTTSGGEEAAPQKFGDQMPTLM